jgi:hypothetical protein
VYDLYKHPCVYPSDCGPFMCTHQKMFRACTRIRSHALFSKSPQQHARRSEMQLCAESEYDVVIHLHTGAALAKACPSLAAGSFKNREWSPHAWFSSAVDWLLVFVFVEMSRLVWFGFFWESCNMAHTSWRQTCGSDYAEMPINEQAC